MQPNAFYAAEGNQQPQIWNPQCPSQASTSSFHHQSPVIIQPGNVPMRLSQQLQQQHISPQHSSSMPIPMLDVNNVIVKQEYPSTIPPMQSNVMQYNMQQSPSTLPHHLMQNAGEQPQMRSLRSSNTVSSDNQPMPAQTVFHTSPIPINQFHMQQSAVLNVQNIMSPSNTTTQSNTVFHQQQQQRNVMQPNSLPANNQSNM